MSSLNLSFFFYFLRGVSLVLIRLSEEERQVVIKELAEKLKDIVFMNAEEKAREVVDMIDGRDIDPNGEVILEFTLSFNVIIQIIGRMRRKQ